MIRGRFLDAYNPINWNSPLARGLVGFWLADNRSFGTRKLYDLCKKNDGVLTSGPTWSRTNKSFGEVGSVEFSGGSQTVNFPLIPALNGASNVTLAGWFYKSQGNSAIAFARDSVLLSVRFGIYWYSDSNCYNILDDGLGNETYGLYTPATIGWHFMSIVFDGTLIGNVRIHAYMDGKIQNLSYAGTIPSSIPTSLSNTLMLNRTNQSIFGTGNYGGQFLFFRSLTERENLALYNESLAGYPTLLNRIKTTRYVLPIKPTYTTIGGSTGFLGFRTYTQF